MTKVILCGSSGRMGSVICDLAATMPDVEIVAGIDKVGQTAHFLTYANIGDCNAVADVIISFLPATEINDTKALIDYGVARQMPVVICTTGLPVNVEALIADASKKVAVLQSANMSLGINLFVNMLSRASKLLFDSQFDIEIIEKHHNKKLDAPSGTATLFAKTIAQALGDEMHMVYDRSDTHKERQRNEIGMHAIRGGSIVGEHSVIFAGQGEVIEFKHAAQSREVFAVGAIKAAHFLKDKPPGLYTMQDLINEL